MANSKLLIVDFKMRYFFKKRKDPIRYCYLYSIFYSYTWASAIL